MLERAGSCLESAGRRILRDSNGALRSRRSLSRHFWKYNTSRGDVPGWFVALVQPSAQHHPSYLRFSQPETKAANDRDPPVLDFLCPQQPQDLAALRPSRQSKRLGLRRRRKALAGFSRSYTSDASSILKETSKDELQVPETISELEGVDVPTQATQHLIELLKKKGADFDRAWSQLKKLKSPYLQSSKLIAICEQAISKGFGSACCALVFASFWTAHNWHRALEVWTLVSQPSTKDGQSPSNQLFDHLKQGRLFWDAMSLAKFIEHCPTNTTARDFADFLLWRIFSAPHALRDASLNILIDNLHKYHELGLLRANHYLRLIRTFQADDKRSVFTRSIVVYRMMRRQQPDLIPPRSLFEKQLRAMASFGITNGVKFFLDEWSHFYGKPSIDLYKHALIAFSRVEGVEQVNLIFNKCVEDHPPTTLRIFTPLLDAHARTGNIEETRRQFQRISKDFQLKPNTVCWNILLKAHANAKDVNGALATYLQMRRAGIHPNSHTFGTLMGLFANQGDIDNTRKLLTEAEKCRVSITAPMLDTIVQVYCKNGMLQQAEQFADACLAYDVEGPRTRMWNILMFQHAFRVDLNSLNRIWERMVKAGTRPDAMTHAAHLLALVLVGKTDEAREFLRKLHKRRTIHVTEYHYAIILYGYVKKRNRDMVHIIFGEIENRFGQAGTRSSLLKLRGQLEHDLELAQETKQRGPDLRLENAEQTLLEIIGQVQVPKTIGLSSLSKPGEPLGSPSTCTVAHFEYLIKEYGSKGAFKRAQELYQQYMESRKLSSPNDENMPIGLVTAMMHAHLTAGHYKDVEECWKFVFPNAIKKASSIDIDQTFTIPPATETSTATHGLPERPSSSSNRDPFSASQTPLAKPTIIFSQRFILSRALGVYMRAMAYQNEPEKILTTVPQYEAAGFQMNTFNWSTYVQMLAASDRDVDIAEAFRTFETKFMPHFPGWRRLQLGHGFRPHGAPLTIMAMEDPRVPPPGPRFLGKLSKQYWSRIDPTFIQPTYVSMVYLSAALDRVREQSILNDGKELEKLYEVAPSTIDELGRMPYLRDKFQGVLLRHRSEQPDKEPKKRPYRQSVERGGVLGLSIPKKEKSVARREWAKKDQARLAQSPVGLKTGRARHVHAQFESDLWDLEEDVLSPEDRYDYDRAIQARAQRFQRNLAHIQRMSSKAAQDTPPAELAEEKPQAKSQRNAPAK
ncbi:hypothetical protein N7462_007060 [Penicillium macrosclerotiorum]|uniref:uncharacterized protein n=1 Tax=Penicillium macrosclerotiorum TaxID=303699 RepID=UPI002547F409|nr:uncharacterized protein N7462_007060 [Penicillium macrosclerotiorum]KAJ5678816.1 hypothetical protein N7462_007060 [Penicillium macrosclerotiorum]